MCFTSTIESARFTAAAAIESAPCSRVRFTAASRQDSAVMKLLMTAHKAIAASRVLEGTAAGPAHQRIAVLPIAIRTIAQVAFSARVARNVKRKAQRIQA